MTHAKDEALKQAIDALEDERYVSRYTHIDEAITAIRTALAQPEQPVQPVESSDKDAEIARLMACLKVANASVERFTKDDFYENGWHDAIRSLQDAAAPTAQPEADELLTALGLDPNTYRTDGGWVNIPKIVAAIKSPQDYPHLEPVQPEQPVVKWHKGEPPYPYKTEWFIARTKSRDRVVLQALPEEYSYHYTTADGTYIKADQITKWMQFPDSMLIAFEPPQQPVRVGRDLASLQPAPVALIQECQTALAEELAAYDIDPPLHHILQAHDKCVAWLVGAGVLVYCTACERNVKGPCNSVECSTPEPTPQPVQIGDKT